MGVTINIIVVFVIGMDTAEYFLVLTAVQAGIITTMRIMVVGTDTDIIITIGTEAVGIMTVFTTIGIMCVNP
jgi:hypothetical protein